MTADQALAQVGEFGWKIDRQDQYDDATAAGQVIRQDPPPGSKLKEGATLALVVSRGPTPVAIPDLTGMSDGQAGEALKNAGLVAVTPVTEAFDENVPAHFVVSWDPKGTELPKGSSVNLVVSKGPAPRQVPQISGSFADAKAALANVQLKAKQVDVFSDTVPAGQVVSTQPAAGASAPRGRDGHSERVEGSRPHRDPGRSGTRSSTTRSRSSRPPGCRPARSTGRRRAGRSRPTPARDRWSRGQRGRHLPRLRPSIGACAHPSGAVRRPWSGGRRAMFTCRWRCACR